MKKSIIITTIILAILSVIIVLATSITLPQKYQAITTPSQSADAGQTGKWGIMGSANITDGDKTTYGKGNAENYSILYANFTNYLQSDSSSLIEITYNTSLGTSKKSENFTSGDCFNKDRTGKTQLMLNSSNIGGTKTIVLYCGNYSTWTNLLTSTGQDEVYDIRIYWNIPIVNYDYGYSLKEPDEYATSTSTSILFNMTGNWTGGNGTTINCSLYTRYNNTMSYTLNSTAQTLINRSWNGSSGADSSVNYTITFPDKSRTWWFWRCEDNNSREIQNTTARIFDIDTTYSQLSIGVNQVINMSVTTGNIVTMGSLTTGTSITAGTTITSGGLASLNSIKLTNLSTYEACDATQNGRIVYNASEHWVMLCNSTDWARLWP